MIKESTGDWFIGGQFDAHVAAVIPRVFPVEPNKTVIMIRHKRGKGALGGHITRAESATIHQKNLLDVRALSQTLSREAKEEGGLDIGEYIEKNGRVIGLAEVLMVRRDAHTSVDALIPMVLCNIPGGLPFNEQVMRVPWGHIPAHTYPDAALTLIHMYTHPHILNDDRPIMPEWLNRWGKVVFELSPKRRYLQGRPPLERLGYIYRHPPIPQKYPEDIKRWMELQYEKL